MASTRYRKLFIDPTKEITSRTTQGMIVVGDYIDPLNKQRVLLLERPEIAAKEWPAPKPKMARKRKLKTNANATGEATAFPGAGVTNGA
jgi:hypothetical protein